MRYARLPISRGCFFSLLPLSLEVLLEDLLLEVAMGHFRIKILRRYHDGARSRRQRGPGSSTPGARGPRRAGPTPGRYAP